MSEHEWVLTLFQIGADPIVLAWYDSGQLHVTGWGFFVVAVVLTVLAPHKAIRVKIVAAPTEGETP